VLRATDGTGCAIARVAICGRRFQVRLVLAAAVLSGERSAVRRQKFGIATSHRDATLHGLERRIASPGAGVDRVGAGAPGQNALRRSTEVLAQIADSSQCARFIATAKTAIAGTTMTTRSLRLDWEGHRTKESIGLPARHTCGFSLGSVSDYRRKNMPDLARNSAAERVDPFHVYPHEWRLARIPDKGCSKHALFRRIQAAASRGPVECRSRVVLRRAPYRCGDQEAVRRQSRDRRQERTDNQLARAGTSGARRQAYRSTSSPQTKREKSWQASRTWYMEFARMPGELGENRR